MRLGAAPFVIALAGIVGLGYGQSGLPDLIVKSVRVSPVDLEEGQAALVRAVIANIGQGDAFGFDVIFELDGQELATRSIFELKKDKSLEIQIPWKALVGTHTLKVSVDAPFSRVRETNESNNKRSLAFAVSPIAGVRSFTLDLVKLFGRALSETGSRCTLSLLITSLRL
jgi:subtilase family serine protease